MKKQILRRPGLENLFLKLSIFMMIGILFLPISEIYAKDLGVHGEIFEIRERHLLNWIEKRLKELNRGGEIKKMQEVMQEEIRRRLFRPKEVDGISFAPAFFSASISSFVSEVDKRGQGKRTLNKRKLNKKKLSKGRLGKKERSWLHDPSYILKEDIVDQNNQVLHRSGKKINPLEFFSLPCDLLFIDGDDQDQMKWALKESIKDDDKGGDKNGRKNGRKNEKKKEKENEGKEEGKKEGEKGGREDGKKEERRNADKKAVKIILVRGAILSLMKGHKRALYFDQQGVLTRYFGIKHVPAKITQEGKKLKVEEVFLNKGF